MSYKVKELVGSGLKCPCHDTLAQRGWLDERHFNAENISGGSCSFTSDKGYDYEVTIIGQGWLFLKCYHNGTTT